MGGGNRLPSRAFPEAVPLCILARFVCSPHRGLLPLEGTLLLRGAFSWGEEGQRRGFPTVSTHLDVALLERRGRFFLKREGWASERVSGECIPLTHTPWFVKKCLVREATAPLQRAFLRSSALLWGELGSREVNLIQHH